MNRFGPITYWAVAPEAAGTGETAMFEHERRTKSLAGRWARALGVSTDRLAAIVREVVEERQALGTRSQRRRLVAQPID